MFFVEALRLYTDTCPCATVGTWEGSTVRLLEERGILVKVHFVDNTAHLLTRGDNRRPLCFSLQFSLCCRPCFESLGSVRKKMAETRGLQGLLASQGQEWLEFRGKVSFSKSCELSLLPA
jgi:hypothetical protein